MSFCSMDLVKKIGIQGSPQVLSLDTLYMGTQVDTLEVDLEVSGSKDGGGKTFHLPRVCALRVSYTSR